MDYPPLKLINKWSYHIPSCWDEIENMRSDRGINLPNWDDDCYIPISGTIAVVSRGEDVSLFMIGPAAELAAIASWRQYKEAYRFSPEMQEILFSQAVDCVIPVEILKNLPFPCIYIELQETDESLQGLHGFFVHIEHDVKTNRKELRFLLLNYDGTTYPMAIHLIPGGTIKDGISAMITEADQQRINAKIQTIFDIGIMSKFKNDLVEAASKLMQLVLYICAENAEIEENPNQKKITKRTGYIKDKYREIRKWDVGIRTTKMIRSIRTSDKFVRYTDIDNLRTGKGTSKRPHVRRGHWHHFWTGPRNSKERKLILRWIGPLQINMNKCEDAVVVIREIKNEKN